MKTKTRLMLPLLILMPLAACQSEQPAATTTPASHLSPTTTTTSPAASTVAVTKEAIETHAKDLQANIAQNKAAVTKVAEQLTESLTDNAKAAEEAATTAKAAEAAKAAATAKAAEAAKAAKASHNATASMATSLTAAKPHTLAAGNAAKGKSLANKCKGCHHFTAKKKVGPGLQGVVGRKSGSMVGMKYSAALAAGGWVWNEKNLAGWLCDSKKAVKTLSGNASAKTKMPAQRICDTTKQADLIAFLKTL